MNPSPKSTNGTSTDQASQMDAVQVSRPITPEDAGRAGYYSLVSRLFIAPPDLELLGQLADALPSIGDAQQNEPLLQGEDLGREFRSSLIRLCTAAGVVELEAVQVEFDAIFGGMGKPKVARHASFYLAGFLNEKPLAKLRTWLTDVGIEVTSNAEAEDEYETNNGNETEDHLSVLAEAMRFLITEFQATAKERFEQQRSLFAAYINPWKSRFYDDLTVMPEANFYLCAAQFMLAFFRIEEEQFAMDF